MFATTKFVEAKMAYAIIYLRNQVSSELPSKITSRLCHLDLLVKNHVGIYSPHDLTGN